MAEVKPRLSLAPLSHNGEALEQTLGSGVVWALKGVIGSEQTRSR